MITIRTLVIKSILLILSFNSFSNEIKPTDTELVSHLLLKSDDFETLISILDETEYTAVFWIKNGTLNAKIGNNKNVAWDKPPKLDAFVMKATELGIGSLLAGVDISGNWTISTGQRVSFLKDEPTMLKTIKLNYWYGNKPKHQKCTLEIIRKNKGGTCYLPIKENWFLFKRWSTHNTKLDQT